MADYNIDNLGEPTVGSQFIPSDTPDYGFGPDSQGGAIPTVKPIVDMQAEAVPAPEEKIETFDQFREKVQKVPEESKFDPTYFDYGQSRAEKFEKSPYYKVLGFNPNLGERIEEERYAKFQTGIDETLRMVGGWGAGLGHGFAQEVKSIGNFVNAISHPSLAQSFQRDQLEEINRKQIEFDNNWHIFKGENPTWYSSFASGVQSTGHFIGALAEIATETLLTQALVAGTGGAAAPEEAVLAAKWARLLGTGAETVAEAGKAATYATNAEEFARNSAKMADIFSSPNIINKTWVNMGKFAQSASKIIPGVGNTVNYLGDLARYGAEAGSVATMGKGILAFTNDIRSINHAVSFASSNAAGTYQELVEDQKEQYRRTHGGAEPDEFEIETMKERAMKGAKVDGAINAYAMLYLEKIAFKNILNSRATLQESLGKSGSDVFSNIGVKPSYIKGSAEAPFYVKQKINWGNFKSSLFRWGSEAGNYGELGKSAIQHGLSFGVTMNIMDAVDKGTKAYYDAYFDNNNITVFNAVRDGVDAQFTKEGAKTFISGFTQGALLLGLFGAAFRKGVIDPFTDWSRARYEKSTLSPEDLASLKSQREADEVKRATNVSEFVNRMNQDWANPVNPIKSTIQGAVRQSSFMNDSDENIQKGERKAYHDNKDDATRDFLYTMIKNGLADSYVDRLTEYVKNYSPEDLCKAFEIPYTPENYDAIKNEIGNLPGRLKDIKRLKREIDGKMINKFNPWAKDENGKRKFMEGTEEYEKEYNNWALFELSKDKIVMLKDITERNIVRQNEILNGKNGSTGVMDMPFAKNIDFSTLFTASSIEMLDSYIAVQDELLFGDTPSPGAKESKKAAETYRKALQDYTDAYLKLLKDGHQADPEKNKELNDAHKKALTEGLYEFLKNEIQQRNITTNKKASEAAGVPEYNEVEDAIEKMMDYYRLGIEQGSALRYLNILLDPAILKRYQANFIKEGRERQKEAGAGPGGKSKFEKDLRNQEDTLIAKIMRINSEGDLANKEKIITRWKQELSIIQNKLKSAGFEPRQFDEFEELKKQQAGTQAGTPPTPPPPTGTGTGTTADTGEGLTNEQKRDAFLAKNNLKLVNRDSKGNVRGGQPGWKARINLNAVSDVDYKNKALKVIAWLNKYFNTTSPTDYDDSRYFAYRKGEPSSIWKHLSGGDKGEADFTIYIGSDDDLRKFAQDVENSEIKDIIKQGKSLSTTRSTNDVAVTDNVSARFDPIGGKSIFSYVAIFPKKLNALLKDANFSEMINVPIKIGNNKYLINDTDVMIFTGDSSGRTLNSASKEDLAKFAEIRDYFFRLLYGKYYNNGSLFDAELSRTTDIRTKEELLEQKRKLLNYYVDQYGDQISVELSGHLELENELNTIDRLYQGEDKVDEHKQARKEVIEKYFNDLIDNMEDYDFAPYSNLKDTPGIEQVGSTSTGKPLYAVVTGKDKKRVDSSSYTSITLAKNALEAYLNKEYPVIEGTNFRKGQIIYNKSTGQEYTIAGIDKDKDIILNESTNGISRKVKVTVPVQDMSLYVTDKEMVDNKTEESNFNPNQPKSTDPWAIVNVAIPKEGGPSSKESENDVNRFKEVILSIPHAANTTGEGFSIRVTKNPERTKEQKEKYPDINPIPGNTQIFQKRQDYTIELLYNGQTIGYVTNPSSQYYVDPNNVTKTIGTLTLSDIQALYAMKGDNPMSKFATAQEWKNHLEETEKDSFMFDALVKEALKKGGTLELTDKVKFVPHYQFNFIKRGEVGPKLSEIPGLQVGDYGLKMYVYNNYTDDQRVVQSTMTPSEAKYAKEIMPVGQQSYMTAVVIMENGKFIPIQLTPRQINPEEITTLLDTLSNVDTEEKLKAANSALSKLFVALRVYDEGQYSNKGISVIMNSIGVGEENHLYGRVIQRIGREYINLGSFNINPAKGEQLAFNDVEDLLKKINQELRKNDVEFDHPDLTVDNLKWQPDVMNIGDMEASVQPDIFKSISLTYFVPDTSGKKRAYEVVPFIPTVTPTGTDVKGVLSTDLQKRKEDLDPDLKLIDQDLIDARNGDVEKQKKFESYDIDWRQTTTYRFIGQSELDALLSNKTIESKRFVDAGIDVTSSPIVTTAADKDYRVTFKESFDKNNGLGKVVKKNEEDSNLQKGRGYNINDVQRIEQIDDNGNVTNVIYDAELATTTGTPVSDIDAQRADIERRRKEEIKALNIKGKQIDKWKEIRQYGLTIGEAVDAIYDYLDELSNEGQEKRRNGEDHSDIVNEHKRLRELALFALERVQNAEDRKEKVQDVLDEIELQKERIENSRQSTHRAGIINLNYDAELAALGKEEAGTTEEQIQAAIDEFVEGFDEVKQTSAYFFYLKGIEDQYNIDPNSYDESADPEEIKNHFITQIKNSFEKVDKKEEEGNIDDIIEDTKPAPPIDPDDAPFKLIASDTFDEHDVEDIDTFNAFMKENLPDWLTVGELDEITANMKTNKIVVGQFVMYLNDLGKIVGRIETKAKNPGKYHEVGHAVFRMLLSQKRIDELLKEANKINPVTPEQLNEFRNSHQRYEKMSEEDLKDEYQEEFIMDEFDKYFMGKKSKATSGMRAFFNRILDWFRWVWDRWFGGSRMRAMFYEVSTKKFKNARLQDNDFTHDNAFITTEPVPSIKVGRNTTKVKLSDGTTKEITYDKYLKREEAAAIISSMRAEIMLEMATGKYTNYNQAINVVLNRWQNTYDYNSDINKSRIASISNPIARKGYETAMLERHHLFNEKESRDQLTSAIVNELRIHGIKNALDREAFEDDVTELGDRNADNRFINLASIGGYESIGRDLKMYIGSNHIKLTDINKKDKFGIDYHADGTPIIEAVDTNYIYSGLLKLMSGSSNVTEVLNRVDAYMNTGNNPETIKFLQNMISETGFNLSKFKETGEIECSSLQGMNLFNRVMKGFMQIAYNYTNVVIDPNNGETFVMDASNEKAERNQFREWSNDFYQKYWTKVLAVKNNTDRKAIYKQAVAPLEMLVDQTNTISARKSIIPDEDNANEGTIGISTLSKNISNSIYTNLGIYYHPDFIMYSIISGKEVLARTPQQQNFVNRFNRVKPIDMKKLRTDLMDYLKENLNPFVRFEGSNEASSAEKFLLFTAKNNALIDERINTTSHTNGKGDIIYDYGFRNFNADAVDELNNSAVIEKKLNDPEYSGSFVLSDPDFLYIDKKLYIAGSIGHKESYLVKEKDETGAEYVERKIKAIDANKLATDFGETDGGEYMFYMLAQYDISKQQDAYIKRPDGSVFYATLVNLGPIAEKSNNHSVRMAIKKTVEKTATGWKVNDKTKELLFNVVKDEVARIKRVQEEIAEGKEARIAAGKSWGKDYHDGTIAPNGKITKGFKGLRLFKTYNLLNVKVRPSDIDTVAEKINELATNPTFKVEQELSDIYKAIEISLQETVKNTKEFLVEKGMITSDTKNLMLPAYLFNGFDKLKNEATNIRPNDFNHNLAQVVINNYINYIGITHALYGDESLRVKDFTDLWKRRAGVNGQGPSVNNLGYVPGTDIVPVSTVQHVTYPDDTDVDIEEVDNGQMLQTAKGTFMFLLGQGKMNDVKAKMLDSLASGKPLTVEQQLEMLKTNGVFNPMKLMYDDGHTYLKCSSMTLLKEDTSYWSKAEQKWLPLPGRDLNHTKLEKATEQEDGFDPSTGEYKNNVVLLHPISVTKGMKDSIAPSIEEIDSKYFKDIDAKYLRLQVENPSGKTHGTEPIQPKYQMLAGHNENLDTPIYVKNIGRVKTQTVIDQYMEAVRQRKYNNAIMAIAEIFDTEHPITNINDLPEDLTASMSKFMDMTRDTLLATGADSQTLEFYQTDKLGNAKFDINLPPIMEKATQMLLSHFIKGVTKEKVPLWSMTIIADSGFSVIRKVTHLDAEGQPVYSKCPIITMDEYKKDPERYNKTINIAKRNSEDKFENLAIIAEQEAKQGNALYVADVLRDIVPMYDDKGNVLFYYTEGLRPFLTEDEIKNNKLSEVYDYVVGARIPGTNKHSYTVTKWVDRISTSHGTSCVLSRRVMLRDGHDNDLDKFYVQIPDTYINDQGVRVPYGSAIDKRGMFIEYLTYQEENNSMLRKKVRALYEEDTELKDCLNELSAKKKQQPELVQQIVDVNRLLSDTVPEGEIVTNRGIVDSDEVYTHGSEETGFKEGKKQYWSNVLLEHKNYNPLYKSAKKELLKLFKENSQDIPALVQKVEKVKHLLFLRAMEELKLPANVDDFINRGGVRLNNGVLTNRAIALQAALLSSEHISGGGKDAIINEATTTDHIKKYADDLVKFLRTPVDGVVSPFAENTAKQIEDISGDHNSMVAQAIAYDMNKGGTRDVGAVANVIQVGSILNQFNVKVVNVLPYVFDGNVLNDYGRDKTVSGNTIGSQIDTLAQMDVDATKDHLPARFSLTTEFSGYLANMMRLGQDIEVALLYPLTPVWKEYAKRTKDSGKNFRVGLPENADRVIADIKQRLEKAGAQRVPLNQKVIMDYLRTGKKNINVELSLIHDLEIMKTQFEPIRHIAKILTLDTGRSLTTLEDIQKVQDAYKKLGIGLDDEKFKKTSISIDVRNIVTHRHGVLSANYRIFQVMNDKLLPKFLLAKTDAYREMREMIYKNFNIPVNNPSFTKSIDFNLLSALTIIPYMKWLKDNGMVEFLDSMNHNLIWAPADSNLSIVKMIKDGRELLKGKNANPALNAFLNIVEKDAAKGVNINQVIVNSFTKLSEQLQTKVVQSITDIIANEKPEIHRLGIAIMNYLFVKDGAQFKYGSFIRFMPTFMFENWSGVISETVKKLSTITKDDTESYVNLMGYTHSDLMERIISSIGTHVTMVPYLMEYGKGNYDDYKVPDGVSAEVKAELERFGSKSIPVYEQTKTGNIIIDIFNGIRNWKDLGEYGYVYEKSGQPYDEVELEKMKKNLSYAEAAGFTRIGNTLEFPINIQKNGRVYQLKKVGREETDNFVGLLRPGQLIPTGLLATYVPTEPDGDKKQISVAKAIFGQYPYKVTGLPEGVLGEIQTNLIGDWVMAGTATTTIRTDSYHKFFYKGEGVYKMSNGQFADVKEIGIARKVDDQIIIDGNDGKVYKMDLDAFGRREGFGNWEGFLKGQRYSSGFISGAETRHFYTIKPALKLPESVYKKSEVISVPETDVTRELFQTYKINTIQVGEQLMFMKNGELWKTATQLKLEGINTRKALLEALRTGSLSTSAEETGKQIGKQTGKQTAVPVVEIERIEPNGRKVTRAEINSNPKTLYIYGDNTERKGYGGAAKEMRPLNGDNPNSFGIASKKAPATKPGDYFTDAELEQNKQIIKADTDKIIRELMTGKYNKVVIAPIGIAGGLADLENKAPQTFAYLQSQLDRLNNFIKSAQGTQAPVSEVTNTGTQYPNKPEFNKLPAKLDKPTMTYAGIGSRETPAEVLAQMTEVARELERRGYTLNTGVSFKNKKEGADEAFYKGTALLYNLFSPEKQGSRTREQAIAKEVHPNPSALTEGALKLMARNTNQVFGDNLSTPVDFVLFYAKETNNPLRPQGGTGQAVEMARRKGIVTINMADPNWRSQLNTAIGIKEEVTTEGEDEEIRDQRFDANDYPMLSQIGMTDSEYKVLEKDPQKWEDALLHSDNVEIDLYDENFLEDLTVIADAIAYSKISDKDILDTYSKDKGIKEQFLEKAKRMLEKAEKTKDSFINKQIELDLTETFEFENDVKKEELAPEDSELSDFIADRDNRLVSLSTAHKEWKKQMLDYIKNCL